METRTGHLSTAPVSPWRPTAEADAFAGRREAWLAKSVGLTQFGVNHLTLEPGAMSSLRHWHETEDEFVLVLSGTLVLIDDNGERLLVEGDYAGFPAGYANAHHLTNRSKGPATCIVVGTRKVGTETIHYPDNQVGPIIVLRDGQGDRITR